MDSSGPKDAQVQSYSPGGANVPLWKDTLPSRCRITLNDPSTTAMRLMANYFDHLLSLDTPTYTVAQITNWFEPSTVLWAFHTIQPPSFISDVAPCWNKIILKNLRPESLPLVTLLEQFYFISEWFLVKIKHWNILKFFKIIVFHFMMEPRLK